jgi:type II secretion system protein N
MAELALPGAPARRSWLRRLLVPVTFVFGFGLFLYLTFPFGVVVQRLEIEARKSGVELSVKSLGPLGLLGMRARGVSLRASSEGGAPGPELRLERLDVRPAPLDLAMRRIVVAFAAGAMGGELQGRAQVSTDPKLPGISALAFDLAGLELKELPAGLLPGTELLGRLGLKLDLTSVNQLEAANGTVSLTGSQLALVKGQLKLGEGMGGIPLPKLLLGEVSGAITIDKGVAKVDRLTAKGGDVELDVDGTIRLRPLLSLSIAELHVKVRPQERWLEANPLVKGSMGFLGPKGPDGWVATLTGPLSRLQPRPGR